MGRKVKELNDLKKKRRELKKNLEEADGEELEELREKRRKLNDEIWEKIQKKHKETIEEYLEKAPEKSEELKELVNKREKMEKNLQEAKEDKNPGSYFKLKSELDKTKHQITKQLMDEGVIPDLAEMKMKGKGEEAEVTTRRKGWSGVKEEKEAREEKH